MIKIGTVHELDQDIYDENWMIVRKPDSIPSFVIHEPLLSPSQELFLKYREAFHAGLFDQYYFDTIYVSQFILDLKKNEAALELLKELERKSSKKDIFIACYCENESMCHRSIIAGILLGMGAEINTNPVYIKYYEKFK